MCPTWYCNALMSRPHEERSANDREEEKVQEKYKSECRGLGRRAAQRLCEGLDGEISSQGVNQYHTPCAVHPASALFKSKQRYTYSVKINLCREAFPTCQVSLRIVRPMGS